MKIVKSGAGGGGGRGGIETLLCAAVTTANYGHGLEAFNVCSTFDRCMLKNNKAVLNLCALT
jgi:hypothetical protein